MIYVSKEFIDKFEVKNPGRKIFEKDISAKIVDGLNKLDPPHTYAYKRKAGPGRKGQPDISGCVHGVRIEIEVKMKGKLPTDLQRDKINTYKMAGAVSGIATSFHEVIDLLSEHGLVTIVHKI